MSYADGLKNALGGNYEEDPGSCPYCGEEYELVRPGKSQPVCDCQDTVTIQKWRLKELLQKLTNLRIENRRAIRELQKYT